MLLSQTGFPDLESATKMWLSIDVAALQKKHLTKIVYSRSD